MTHSPKPSAVLATAFFLLMLHSCIVVDDESNTFVPCQEGSGQVETTKFERPPFTGIELRGDVDVFFSQGPEQEIEARGHTNLLEELILEVDGQDLEIRTRRCISPRDRLQLFITIPQIDRVVNSSAADIVSENTLVTNNIELTASGSGNVEIAIITDVLKANLSGSGNLLAEGEAATLNLKITGSGDFNGFGLVAVSSMVFISGSGDAEVFAQDFLEASISGSGDVFYKGDPFLEVRLTGSGRVIDAN